MRHPLPALLRVLPLVGFSTFAADRPAPQPNIILLESDDHHYLALGCMGDAVKTPNIDKLAARGVLFRNNICQGTMCAPSRNALVTGSYPHQTGVFHNRDGNMAPGVWTFPAALQRAGYTTALVGKNHFLPPLDSAGRPEGQSDELKLEGTRALGFEHLHSMGGKVSVATPSRNQADNDPYRAYLKDQGLLGKLEEDYAKNRKRGASQDVHPSVLAEADHQDSYIARKAIEWLAADRGDKPFFLWVDFVAPHPPADPPLPYAGMYDWREMRPPLPRPQSGAVRAKRREEIPAEEYQKFRAGYYAMITALDAQIGRILQAIEERGQLNNTVIVFAGDQGSMLGDLGMWGKGVFYKGSINSPLVIAGASDWLQGAKVDQPVELIDLVPTFLELARASDSDRKACYGQSLLPLLTGQGRYARTVAFAEDEDHQMAVDARYKFVKHAKEPMLFDMQSDPNELKNLVGTLPDVESRMRQHIADWFAKSPPVRAPNQKPKQTPKSDRSPGATPPAPDRSRAFKNWDKDGDDVLTLDEYRNGLSKPDNAEARFKNFDKNGDGKLSRDEFINPPAK